MNQLSLEDRLKLYVVTDERKDGMELLSILEEAILGGATAVQLRRKHDDGRAFVALGRAIRNLTTKYNVLYFVNDRVDIALLTDADGVHIGQSDISCLDARKLLGDRIIGVSAVSLSEARQAEQDGANYLGVGAIYATKSKDDADYCGLAGLADITKNVQLPTVAIGGISKYNVRDVMQAGADGIAVVSEIMQAESPRLAAEDLVTLMKEYQKPC